MDLSSLFEKEYEQNIFWHMKENSYVVFDYKLFTREFSTLFKESYSLVFLVELLKNDLSMDKSQKFKVIIDFPSFSNTQIVDLFNTLLNNKYKLQNMSNEKVDELNQLKNIRFIEWESIGVDFKNYEDEKIEKIRKKEVHVFETIRDNYDEEVMIKFDANLIEKKNINLIDHLFENLIELDKLGDNDYYEGFEKENNTIVFTFFSDSSKKILKEIQKIINKNKGLFKNGVLYQHVFDIVKNPKEKDLDFFKKYSIIDFIILNFNIGSNDNIEEIKIIYESLKKIEIYDEGLGKLNFTIQLINNNSFEIIDEIKKSINNYSLFINGEIGIKYINTFNLNEKSKDFKQKIKELFN